MIVLIAKIQARDANADFQYHQRLANSNNKDGLELKFDF